MVLVLCSFTTYAEEEAPVQSLLLLQELVEKHILNTLSSEQTNKIRVTVDKIDPRLRLKPCAEEHIDIFNPHRHAALNTSTMGIRCLENENHWSLYVPVKIIILKQVVVAARTLEKGAAITPLTIDLEEVDISQLKQGYFVEVDEVLGLSSRHQITQGTILTPALLQKTVMIHKGEQVTIHAQNDTLHISMDGIALADGVAGETITVKNISSKKIIEGRVVSPGQVRINI